MSPKEGLAFLTITNALDCNLTVTPDAFGKLDSIKVSSSDYHTYKDIDIHRGVFNVTIKANKCKVKGNYAVTDGDTVVVNDVDLKTHGPVRETHIKKGTPNKT